MDAKTMHDHLSFVRRSVALGESSIAALKREIGELSRAGRDTSKARKQLSLSEETHRRNLSNRERLEVQIAAERYPAKPVPWRRKS